MLKRFKRDAEIKEGEGNQLAEQVPPLRQVLALATRLPRHFIVRWNDGKTTEFLRKVEGIEAAIEADERLIDIPTVCGEIDVLVQQFAQAQTHQINETLDSFSKALEELVDGLDKTVVDQGVRLIEIQKIKTGLGKVDGTSTLEETKEILSAGIADVSKLVDRELEIQRELRKVHERYKGRLGEDLGRMETEQRIDPVTKIANRVGIEKHLKAACDHTRTNGSSYTFALVNLNGCSALAEQIGTVAADNALIAFAQRLRAVVGGAFIGRLGGDDFVVITSAEVTMLHQLLARLQERLIVHPVGGFNTDAEVALCFSICKIDSSSALDKLVGDCEAAILRQRPVSMAA